jgi:hypothetical protein
MQAAGIALSRKDVQILAFKLTQKLGITHWFCAAKGRVGKDWFVPFIRRHHEISVMKAEGVPLGGEEGMNTEDSREYCEKVTPGRWFNEESWTHFQLRWDRPPTQQ